MKIYNISDIELIKIYLTKYYIANKYDYLFIKPPKYLNEAMVSNIKNYRPDIIVVQQSYANFDGIEIINFIRRSGIYCKIVFLWMDLKEDELVRIKNQIKDLSEIEIVPAKGEDMVYCLNDICAQVEKDSKKKVGELKEKKLGKILFVDDDKFIHQMMNDRIDKNQFELIHAYTGREGIKLYYKELPDIIVTDVEMPEMNGLEMCKKIKEENKNRFIPIIITSSMDRPVDIEMGFDYGADEYLTKPINFDKLNIKIEEYFESVERKRENKILIIEQNKTVMEIMRHSLYKNGFNVVTANNGIEGLKIAFHEVPEVIVLNIEVIGIDGYEICKKIRESKELREVSIIIVNSKNKPADIKKIEQFDIAHNFIIPFDVEKLVLIVERLLIEKYRSYKKEFDYMLLSINSLIKALEARDLYTKGHTERVSKLSIKLGKYLQLDKQTLKELEIGANLHDIGKIGIRDEVLLKTDKLTKDEYITVQRHAVIGAEILNPIKSLNSIIPLVLFHHERWDGKGYPSMLKGDKIPIGARIIAVCDTYDALTTNRPYRKKMTKDDAIKIITDNSGNQFSPEIVEAFVKMIGEEKDI